MSRVYYVPLLAVSVSAAQDFCSLYCGSNMAIQLLEFEINADASTNVAELRLLVKRLPATVTSGSGGSAVTPVPAYSTDGASTFTARINDTTRATTSGTAVNLFPASVQLLNGWQRLPLPETRPSFKPGEACIIGMEVAPSSATVFDAYAVVMEMF